MTETITTRMSFPIPLTRTDGSTHSTDGSPSVPRRHLTMPTWLPRRILQRGAAPTRDDERAMRDLRAALDRSDW